MGRGWVNPDQAARHRHSTVIAIFFVLLESLTGLFGRRAQSSAVAGAPGPAAPHAKREDD
ncbi:MAG: hypothetical protein ACHBNF_17555 [Chromatiales bacterium]